VRGQSENCDADRKLVGVDPSAPRPIREGDDDRPRSGPTGASVPEGILPC